MVCVAFGGSLRQLGVPPQGSVDWVRALVVLRLLTTSESIFRPSQVGAFGAQAEVPILGRFRQW